MIGIDFNDFARQVEHLVGRAVTFWGAVAVIIVWAATGPVFDYSDTWQLVINTATTIVTFLMVFLIQNTQTRDTRAMQLKLDELIRAQENASNALRGIERTKSETELDQMSEPRKGPPKWLR